MASIVKNPKYGNGHQIVLKEAQYISSSTRTQLEKFSYKPAVSKFKISISHENDKSQKFNLIDLSGNETIYLKDEKNQLVKIIGSAGVINNMFNHDNGSSKGDTNLLTELKENISMYVMQSLVENNVALTEDQLIAKLRESDKSYYSTLYYESAVKQAKELVKIMQGNKGYRYERQGKDQTKPIYDKARKLTGKANDNWNPADVWMIKNNYDLKTILASTNSTELNDRIAEAFKERKIIPISLKQVTKNVSLSINDPNKLMNQKLDLNFKLNKIDLSQSMNNFIVWSDSGFGVRVGFKASSTTLNVSLEGRFKGAGYQTGAIDAKAYTDHVKRTHNYNLRGSSTVPESDYNIAIEEFFNIHKKVSSVRDLFPEPEMLFDALKKDEFTRKRFCNLMSYLMSFVDTPEMFEEHMKFCYFSSKKITSDSCLYVIIQ
jgi:hypothetical protein